jgi:hypothetical protein
MSTPIAFILIVLATAVLSAMFAAYYSDFWFDAAFWGMLTTMATIALAFIANHQISAMRSESEQQTMLIREENARERTLRVCMMYDSDPIIVQVSNDLSMQKRAKGEVLSKAADLRTSLIRLFNYYEVIAIGLDQGIYDETIVKMHMQDIIWGDVEYFMKDEVLTQFDSTFKTSYFQRVISLAQKWGPQVYS